MKMYQETGSTVQQKKNTQRCLILAKISNMNIPHFETWESSPVRSNTLLTHMILINNCFKNNVTAQP